MELTPIANAMKGNTCVVIALKSRVNGTRAQSPSPPATVPMTSSTPPIAKPAWERIMSENREKVHMQYKSCKMNNSKL